MSIVHGYRGDNRNPQSVKNSGGFIPKYLLNNHAGGLDGFIACMNKTDGQLGCNCGGHTEGELFTRSREKLLEVLKNPGLLQEHVMFNKLGYLATAIHKDDAYETAHKYVITGIMTFDKFVEEAKTSLNVVGGRRLTDITKKFRIVMNSDILASADLIATIPHGAIELTFLSPIKYQYINDF